MNELDKLAEDFDKNAHVISLIRGIVKGQAHWAYAEIPLSRYLDFQQAQLSEKGYDLGQYAAKILAHGVGAEPPLAVQEEMKAKGFNPDLGVETGKTIAATLQQEPEILFSFKDTLPTLEEGGPKGAGGGASGGRKGRRAA